MYNNDNVGTISDMRLNPKGLLKKAEENPVFMFYRSRPKAVLLSVDEYEKLQDIFEDYLDSLRIEEFMKEDPKKIKWIPFEKIKRDLSDRRRRAKNFSDKY